MNDITIHSSHGWLSVDRQTGRVLEIHRYHPRDPDTLPAISRVNLEEHFTFWRDYQPSTAYEVECRSIDILDVGCWVGDEYEPPEEDWRNECLLHLHEQEQ